MSNRLFLIEKDLDLFDEDSIFKCVIYFVAAFIEEEKQEFRKLIDGWAELGFFQALPSRILMNRMGKNITREGIFSSGMKYFSGVHFSEQMGAVTMADFIADLGSLDEM